MKNILRKNNFVNNLESKPHSKHTGDHHKGKMISEETKNKMSEKKIGIYIGKNNPNFGKHHLEETKIKISDNRKGKCVRENNPNFRITNQKIIDIKIDIERGDLTHKQIAKKNNVGTVTVSKIKTGKIIIK